MNFTRLTPDEAAALIRHGQTIGFSGFTPAGAPKAIPPAIAGRAKAEHSAGQPFQIGVITGASTGSSLDGALAKAGAVLFRTPYQSDPDLRRSINQGRTRFYDMHLSMLPQNLRYGFLGKCDWAIVEACEIRQDGECVLTSSVGAAPTFCHVADRILIELNRFHPPALRGLHDIYEPASPPHRREIPVYRCSDRIGSEVVRLDPAKIVGVVETHAPDEVSPFESPSEITQRIGERVAEFLAGERRRGIIPSEFLPIQSGVGNIANAVLGALGNHRDIPPFSMYTEVVQDAVIALMRQGKVAFASGCSLTVSPDILASIYSELAFFKPRMVLRPQEITNHPEVVRRLGVISINTALEIDIFGNANSTHVMGRHMMNGIGGSGDFTRNAFLSIFTCPSTAKGGRISTIVPAVSHLDHNEHSVQVIVTEHGVADLRGKGPRERANLIVDRCAHPEFRDQLHRYFESCSQSHTPQTLAAAFAMHEHFERTGDMRGVDFNGLCAIPAAR